ncbi:TIM barrel protein [Neolewinella aurantiaca]|uniref:TIM barrel protein n=1 Tax=Neolewinella aurantiaca TaxID=2602767 RepID=A0A5C7FEL1_9BACT|nr:sugar phosphate isomerase/epimerase family protein [Neolewinella aurantiaca]TXF87963.1 TIM barrel protein [Neolewinella aurantiaca]
MNRRNFIRQSVQATAILSLGGAALSSCTPKAAMTDGSGELFFKISLAQWSYHRALQAGEMDALEFAAAARRHECEGLEYVSNFYRKTIGQKGYVQQMGQRAADEGVQNLLIMIGGEGPLASPDSKKRMESIDKHKKWIDAAHTLGCHSVRVDLRGGEHKAEAAEASVESLTRLAEYASDANVNILVENHGGFSSDGAWLAGVMKRVKPKNHGTLPDFGNFCIEKDKQRNCLEEYDRYQGMKELLPYAIGVSAKSYDFDEQGNETTLDYPRILRMVKEVGYRGFIGIEYEGRRLPEPEGIRLTRQLLLKAGSAL